MTLRIQIDCYHEYRCECKPIPQTKVSKQEIMYNLIRCNSGLARYFGKNNVVAQTTVERNEIKRKQQISPYKSIVDQKNLNVLISSKYPVRQPYQPIRQQQKQQIPNPIPSVQLQINNFLQKQVQTLPFLQKSQKNQQNRQIKSPRQKQIKEYFKQLKQTSRYLSDTGFRKYFNRQVFENYGRQNTHGTNDGIIYGNYMKTHNINPHTGSNQPHDEETFYHALTAASPQKLLSPKNVTLNTQQNRTRNISQSRFKEDKQSLQKPIKKHQNDTNQIIGDNLKVHQNLQKLSKSRSKSRGIKILSPNIKNTQKNYTRQTKFESKSPYNKQQNINLLPSQQNFLSPKIQSQYVNTKQIIQPIRPNEKIKNELSPQSNVISRRQEMNKFSEIKSANKKCPVEVLKQSHMEHILSKECKVKPSGVKQNIFY